MRYIVMIFFILCVSLFAQSNIDEDSIHFIGQASAFTVGTNLVTNGDFGSDSGWTKGTGWTTAGGDADCDGSAAGDTELLSTTAITTVTGRVYRVQFEVTVYSAGAIVAVFDSVEVGGDKGTVGVYTTYVAATDNSSTISLIGNSSFIGSCDNVSVVAWVGDLNASGVCTIAGFYASGGELSDYMSSTGGVLHTEAGLEFENNGSSKVRIAAGTTWDTTPQVGGSVNCDFSAQLDSGEDDGIYEITAATSSTIDIDATYGILDADKTVSVWVGGAFPDIATALNDSTLTDDPDGTNRKRYICVNVPMEVDAVSDFVAETSGGGETALLEDDGSRKLIGFYDSIELVTAHSSYRVVSDMDKDQPYYAGAEKAFREDAFSYTIRPNGKLIEWNAKGNAIHIVEINTARLEIRNIKIHNTKTGGTNALIHCDDATVSSGAFINVWFGTADLLQASDQLLHAVMFRDCYFDDSIVSQSVEKIQYSVFVDCIANGTGKANLLAGSNRNDWYGCTFYKSTSGPTFRTGGMVNSCIFIDQVTTCIYANTSAYTLTLINCIFSPDGVGDVGVTLNKGSLNPASGNNIFYSVSGGGALTNPLTNDQISPNPPLPVGTIEKDPLFVNYAKGDYRLRPESPALNGGLGGGSIGIWQPYALPLQERRSRYAGTPLYR